eukprot:COSAG04_NODE_107_length_25959_cov_6.617865_14_plen_221_part_00
MPSLSVASDDASGYSAGCTTGSSSSSSRRAACRGWIAATRRGLASPFTPPPAGTPVPPNTSARYYSRRQIFSRVPIAGVNFSAGKQCSFVTEATGGRQTPLDSTRKALEAWGLGALVSLPEALWLWPLTRWLSGYRSWNFHSPETGYPHGRPMTHILALTLLCLSGSADVVPTLSPNPPGPAASGAAAPHGASAPPDTSQVVPYFEQFVTYVECENMTVT